MNTRPAPHRASNFAPAFWFLPRRSRRALAAVYAFAREVDDIVDELGVDGGRPDQARRLLGAWRETLRNETPASGVTPRVWRDLHDALTMFPIPRRALFELIDGVERDLDQTRYATARDLEAYCYGVAGTVGLACLPLFGLDVENHRTFAVALGRAVQWVNILRDVKTDALRGHLYLPLEDLRKFHVSEEEVLGMVFNDRFRKLMAYEADCARDYFAAARSALPSTSRRAARPALVMGGIYEGLLAKIAAADYNVFSERPRLTPAEKLHRLARAWWETR